MKKYILNILFIIGSITAFAQAEPLNTTPLPNADKVGLDSLKVSDEFADEKNGLKSLALPGWGQYNNKQYFKGGAFLATVGTGIYFTIDKTKEFKKYDKAYTSRLQNFDEPIDDFQNLSLLELADARRDKRRTKDIYTGATTYVYLVNAIDAAAQYKIIRQDPDKHSATKAAYYSAILPGLGQAYNKKYWKIPIVYAALGTAGYFAINNRNYYRDYKRELEFRSVGLSTGFRGALPDDRLKDGLNQWRQYRDIAYVSAGAVYLLNVLDATVDAHLFDYNVDDDLSFKPSPVIDHVDGQLYYGINLTFDFAQTNK